MANGDVLQDEFVGLIIMGFNFNRGTRMGHIFLGLGGGKVRKFWSVGVFKMGRFKVKKVLILLNSD